MQIKIEKRVKVFSLISIIFGVGLAAMTYPLGLIQLEAYATFYGESSSEDVMTVVYPSTTSSDSKMTKQDNLTASKAHKDNPIQDTSPPPTTLPTR
jgi:hypothetical protein